MVRRRRGGAEISLGEAFNDIRADYNAARSSRLRKKLTGVSSLGSGADWHYRTEADYLRVMEWAREFDRNDPVVGQGVTRAIDNVLQQGIKVDPQTGNDKLDAGLRKRWDDWCSDPDLCHSEGEHDFETLAKLVLRGVIVDGDNIVLPLRTGRLEVVEAHRLRTPRTTKNVVHGILLDPETRQRKEYWLTREDVNPRMQIKRVSDMKRFPVRDRDGNRQVFHVYIPKRVSQTRGVSAFAPIMDMIGMHDDIQFAKLVQAQIASCFAIFRQRNADLTGIGGPPAIGEETTETLDDGTVRTIQGIAPGMEITGAPGETLEGFSPNIPNPEFFPHAYLILTFIAINLNLPVMVFLLDPTKTNFSGWRGAMDQARMGMREIQRLMIIKHYRPVYRWKVRQWILEDEELRALASKDGVDAFDHRWSPPYWPYIEPSKDARADKEIVDNRLNSRRAVLARRGLDLDDIDRETIADAKHFIALALDAAEEINKKYPSAAIDWREIAGYKAKKIEPQRAQSGVEHKIADDKGG